MRALPSWCSDIRLSYVRDLACVLLSASLTDDLPVALRHPLSASVWQQKPETLKAWLLALEQHPEALLAALGSHQTRLGRYFETLWLFALTHAPDIKVLAHNWVMYEGKRSIGEIDFIIEDAQGIHHVELAVKFYLAPKALETNLDLYRGPASHDTLGAKVKRLNDHQLRLTEQALVKEQLLARGIQKLKPSAWVTGMLFYPDHSPFWHHHHDWNKPGLWVEIPRLHWLSPYQADHPVAFRQNPDEPQMLGKLVCANGRFQEVDRVLLVPDQRPN